MLDKIGSDTRVYTDIQGLEQLHAQNKKDPKAAKKEVAQQFEAILMQMVLKSMRDANKGFSSDLLNNDQMDFYQDFFDKQLSLVMSNNSTGLAKMIEKNMEQAEGASIPKVDSDTLSAVEVGHQEYSAPKPQPNIISADADILTSKPLIETKDKANFDTEESFIKHLWPAAKIAASALGVEPGVLIAQAALETNWGKKVLPQGKEDSSFNLFNIKADSSWSKKTTTVDSLEQKNGLLVKEKSSFRSYDSFKASFNDYVDFLKQNTRYSHALQKAANPQQFVHALQTAGFATDTNYASKIMKIFSSHTFKNLVAKME